jgi:hypothetical protein
MDEVERQIIERCLARGMLPAVPLLRYTVERDQQKHKAEYAEFVARLADGLHGK